MRSTPTKKTMIRIFIFLLMCFHAVIMTVSFQLSELRYMLSVPLKSKEETKVTTPLYWSYPSSPRITQTKSERLIPISAVPNEKFFTSKGDYVDNDNDIKNMDLGDSNDVTNEEDDTIRVRIWRVLASGKEMTLKQLGSAVGEQKDLRSHLKHVEKQAKTLKNKSNEWRQRRGLSIDDKRKVDKLRLRTRKASNNRFYVKLG